MRRLVIIFAIVVILLFFSGCIKKDKKDLKKLITFSNEGIKVKEFSFPKLKDNMLPEGSVTSLSLILQNIGEADASNIVVTLYSLGAFNIEGVTPTSPTVTCNGYRCEIPSLRRPNPDYQIPGEQVAITWQLRAKSIGVSGVFPQEVKAWITYDYYTYAYKEFLVLSKERLEHYQTHKEELPSLTERVSKAPIDVKINMPETILSNTDISFVIAFENVGKGFLQPSEKCSYPMGCLTNVTIEIEGENVEIKSCSGYANFNINDKVAYAEFVPIISPVSCVLHIGNVKEDTYVLKVSVNYRYALEAKAKIDVAGFSFTQEEEECIDKCMKSCGGNPDTCLTDCESKCKGG